MRQLELTDTLLLQHLIVDVLHFNDASKQGGITFTTDQTIAFRFAMEGQFIQRLTQNKQQEDFFWIFFILTKPPINTHPTVVLNGPSPRAHFFSS